MKAYDSATQEAPSFLLLRRGWYDPMLYLVVGGVTWLTYIAIDPDRDLRLEETIGYTGTRLALILCGLLFLWGTVQGLRGRMVVYIDDDLTPGFADAMATFGIVAGIPMLVAALWLVANAGCLFLLPKGVTPPVFDDYAAHLLIALWALGLLWLYGRVYTYNPGALSAFAALITKLGWCMFALMAFHQAHKSFINEDNKSFGEATENVLYYLILVLVAVQMMQHLTYSGPPLRERSGLVKSSSPKEPWSGEVKE